MRATITLSLLDLRFFSHHGWYEEETRQGQTFSVDLWVSYPEPEEPITELDQTIDYTTIFTLLSEQMHRPRRLLEELAQSILYNIKVNFPDVSHLKIHIQKVAPPVPGLDGRLGVELERSF